MAVHPLDGPGLGVPGPSPARLRPAPGLPLAASAQVSFAPAAGQPLRQGLCPDRLRRDLLAAHGGATLRLDRVRPPHAGPWRSRMPAALPARLPH